MTPGLNIISTRSLLAIGPSTAIAAKQKEFNPVRVTKPAFQSWRSFWHAKTLFEAFAGIFLVFYLFAAVALAVALLFYTFNR